VGLGPVGLDADGLAEGLGRIGAAAFLSQDQAVFEVILSSLLVGGFYFILSPLGSGELNPAT
jgi:hypothetical protein